MPSLGNVFLGDSTDEIGSPLFIEEFISAGAKNYSYKLNNGATVTKVKGFTLSHTNAAKINFESMK